MAKLYRYKPGSPPHFLMDKAVQVVKVFRSPVSAGLGLALECGSYRLHLSQREAERLLTDLQAVIAYNATWQAEHEREGQQEAS